MFRRWNWIVFDGDGGGNGGGGGEPPAHSSGSGQAGDPTQGFQNLVKRQGGLDAAGMLLYQENYSLRDQLREAREQLKKVEGKMPKEGELVLGNEDKTLFERYKALGKPEDWETERKDAQTIKRNQLLSDAATAHGYVPSVLQRLADGLEIEIREVEKDGQKQKTAVVKAQDGEKALPDYAKAQWSEFLPALEKGSQQPPPPSGGVPPTPPPSGDIRKATEQETNKRKQELNQQVRSWM